MVLAVKNNNVITSNIINLVSTRYLSIIKSTATIRATTIAYLVNVLNIQKIIHGIKPAIGTTL